MTATARVSYLYWALTGAVLGLSAPLIFSAGVPLLLLGLVLVLYGAYKKMNPAHLWIAFVAMGLAPLALLLWSFLESGSLTTGAFYGLALFAAIALGGLTLGLRRPLSR
jgi:hypothetical protein